MTKQTRSGYCKECWSCEEPCDKAPNIVLSDADFDDMMSHEDDEPNEALVDLMKETT